MLEEMHEKRGEQDKEDKKDEKDEKFFENMENVLAHLHGALTEEDYDAAEAESACEALQDICGQIAMLRENLGRLAQGDIRLSVEKEGYLAGKMREIQDQLQRIVRYAAWVADREPADFERDLFGAFAGITRDLYDSLSELKASESRLMRTTRELRASEERWKLAAACTKDGIFDIDLFRRTAFFSAHLWDILHLPRSKNETIDFDPALWMSYIHPDDRGVWAELVRRVGTRSSDPDRVEYGEFRVRGKDGRYRWIAAHHMVLKREDGFPYRIIGACEDIQERREQEENIRQQATHDQLTGLPNRYLYNDRFQQQVLLSKRSGTSIILGVWDLDGFKDINDTYGHSVGDQVLIEISRLMKSCLRESDTLARFGGDEFVMLLSCVRETEVEVATRTANRIIEAAKSEIVVDTRSIRIALSGGVAFYPEHTGDPRRLFDMADSALYVAKKKGKDRLQIWEAGTCELPS